MIAVLESEIMGIISVNGYHLRYNIEWGKRKPLDGTKIQSLRLRPEKNLMLVLCAYDNGEWIRPPQANEQKAVDELKRIFGGVKNELR